MKPTFFLKYIFEISIIWFSAKNVERFVHHEYHFNYNITNFTKFVAALKHHITTKNLPNYSILKYSLKQLPI